MFGPCATAGAANVLPASSYTLTDGNWTYWSKCSLIAVGATASSCWKPGEAARLACAHASGREEGARAEPHAEPFHR